MTTEIPKGLYCYFPPELRKVGGEWIITKLKCPYLEESIFCNRHQKEVDDLCKCAECMIGEWKNDPNDHGKYFPWPNSGD